MSKSDETEPLKGGIDGPIESISNISQQLLDSLNVAQERKANKDKLNEIGGLNKLLDVLKIDKSKGLTPEQVAIHKQLYGTNAFPETPLDPYLSLLLDALSDPTLIVLLLAATVSLILGLTVGSKEERSHGWIEGAAIYFAVILVSNIAAGNDYTKQKQFIALEKTSANDERVAVLRSGIKELINPVDIVVGDILVLQAGDQVFADSIIVTEHVEVMSNESSLTGEPDDLKKSLEKDCFLLSSCLVSSGEEVHAMAIGIGSHSQWGKIKEKLAVESSNTPLQDKLEELTKLIGYIGMGSAFATFTALVIGIWARPAHKGDPTNEEIGQGIVQALILAITIVVVAIPEGLPLAVTISLAYSTKKMYQDQCFIRVLQACETMGNATNICSDKTGTLTENRMTIVEGWFGDTVLSQDDFHPEKLNAKVIEFIVEQSSVNRSAYLVYKNAGGAVDLNRPLIIGNKTEGALIMMCKNMGFNYDEVYARVFNPETDKTFSFNSGKKRSTSILRRPDGSVRLYCKGASEWVLKSCTMYTGKDGMPQPLTSGKRSELESLILKYASGALRTLVLAHRDFANFESLPANWEEVLPDNSDLTIDSIIGIIDPLRDDVKKAVKDAQEAGIIVRMVTGDNVVTACAIAKQCGILTDGDTFIEGPEFRNMKPADVDKILPKLRVMARSSPEDKYLLVTRLNGAQLPKDKEEWEKKHHDKIAMNSNFSWETERDNILPGYQEEWELSRPNGGEVVGVTGDGTNDAPALKAADVGLAMGITGTKVAQGASDIVILDDKFSSIVRAIMWGRSVYDNVRKFLQFQLTVNIVALTIVFIGAVTGSGQPLNAVQMLWVNLVMDTMGALALGTETPTVELMQRRPYKRQTTLLSWPMIRFMICQSAFQLTILFVLMFHSSSIFNVEGRPVLHGVQCMDYAVKDKQSYGVIKDLNPNSYQKCSVFEDYCDGNYDSYCALKEHTWTDKTTKFTFSSDFIEKCMVCDQKDYTHDTLVFNSFIFCQLFNEFNARHLFDQKNMLSGILTNVAFMSVIFISIAFQIFLVYVGGDFVKTSPLSAENFMKCVGFGSISLAVGFLSRFIPIKEDPNSFFNSSEIDAVSSYKLSKINTPSSAASPKNLDNTNKVEEGFASVGLLEMNSRDPK